VTKHYPDVEFGLRMPFSMQASLKGRGHALMIKFDIIEKSKCLYSQTETSDFYSYKMINISSGDQLCIFHKLDIQTCFSGYACFFGQFS
jgi:hypothetical protein